MSRGRGLPERDMAWGHRQHQTSAIPQEPGQSQYRRLGVGPLDSGYMEQVVNLQRRPTGCDIVQECEEGKAYWNDRRPNYGYPSVDSCEWNPHLRKSTHHSHDRDYDPARGRKDLSKSSVSSHSHGRGWATSFRSQDCRSDWGDCGGSNWTGYSPNGHNFEQESSQNEWMPNPGRTSTNRTSVPGTCSTTDRGNNSARHRDGGLDWNAPTRNSDRPRDQNNLVRTHNSGKGWDDNVMKNHGRGRGRGSSVRRYQGHVNPGGDAGPSCSFQPDSNHCLAHSKNQESSIQSHCTSSRRDPSVCPSDREQDRRNVATGCDRTPAGVPDVSKPAADLSDICTADDLRAAHNYVSDVNQTPTGACSNLDVPDTAAQCFTRKRNNDFGSLPSESQSRAPKQAKHRPGLSDLTQDTENHARPPDRNNHPCDSHKDAEPAKNAMQTAELDSKIAELRLKPTDQKLQHFIDLVRSSAGKGDSDDATLHEAVAASQLDWRLRLTQEDVKCLPGVPLKAVTLMLGDTVLARSVGLGKAALEQRCYAVALQRLKSMDAQEILALKDGGLEEVVRMVKQAKESVKKPVDPYVWQNLVSVLKTIDPAKIDVISRVERAMVNSKCGLERTYAVSEETKKGRAIYTGSLTIGGLLQGQGKGFVLKECKILAYESAYHRMTSLELSDILKGMTPPDDTEDDFKEADITIHPINTAERVGKLKRFVQKLQTSAVNEKPENRLSKIGLYFEVPVISVLRLLQPDRSDYLCQVLAGDILLGSGNGCPEDAKVKAFDEAHDLVKKTSAQSLLAEARRLTQKDVDAADVVKVEMKAEGKTLESNVEEMSGFYGRMVEAREDWRKQLVVVEIKPCDLALRKGGATTILHHSFDRSGVVLSYVMSSLHTLCVCLVKVQGEIIGMAKGHTKLDAKGLAAMDALFKLYETQPLLKAFSKSPPSDWVTREQLEEGMETTPASQSGEENDQLRRDLSQKLTEPRRNKKAPELGEELQTVCSLSVVAYRLIQDFVERGDCLEELAFAPEVCQIGYAAAAVCQSRGARLNIHRTRYRKVHHYCSVMLRVPPAQVVAAMNERGLTETNFYETTKERHPPTHDAVINEVRASWALPPKELPKKNQSTQPPPPDSSARAGKHDSASASDAQAASSKKNRMVSRRVAPSSPHRQKRAAESIDRQAVMTSLAEALTQAGIAHAGLLQDEDSA